MSLSEKIEPEGSKYYWNDRFIFVEDVKEFIKELKKHPYNRDRFEEQWKEHFKLLNKRKPNQSEIMCFKVGFNAGITLKEQREDKLSGEKLI